MVTFGLFLACNTAPLNGSADDIAPGGKAPWGHPTDAECSEVDLAANAIIDGFHYCEYGGELKKIPIDDPVYERCDAVAQTPAKVLYVTDGARARAYLLDAMDDREIVNDLWGAEPLLIDY